MAMSTKRAAMTAGLSICCSVAIFTAMFFYSGGFSEIGWYCVGLVPLLFALSACVLLWPYRSVLAIRILLTFAAFVTGFVTLEVVGGFLWFMLDKLVRLYQHS